MANHFRCCDFYCPGRNSKIWCKWKTIWCCSQLNGKRVEQHEDMYSSVLHQRHQHHFHYYWLKSSAIEFQFRKNRKFHFQNWFMKYSSSFTKYKKTFQRIRHFAWFVNSKKAKTTTETRRAKKSWQMFSGNGKSSIRKYSEKQRIRLLRQMNIITKMKNFQSNLVEIKEEQNHHRSPLPTVVSPEWCDRWRTSTPHRRELPQPK